MCRHLLIGIFILLLSTNFVTAQSVSTVAGSDVTGTAPPSALASNALNGTESSTTTSVRNGTEIGSYSTIPTTVPIPTSTEPIRIECSKNETLVNCSTTCENRCERRTETCLNQCGPAKCQCIDGFYRNSTGSCVQGHDCGAHLRVADKLARSVSDDASIPMDCSTFYCPPTTSCIMITGDNCTEANCQEDNCEECMQIPYCAKDVLIEYTDNNSSCTKNETYMECTSSCENTCKATEQDCDYKCGPAGCGCIDAYYRNSTGSCVLGHDCEQELKVVTQVPTEQPVVHGCDTIACGNGTECVNLNGKASCVVVNNTEAASCGMNEMWMTPCGSACEPTCVEPKPICATICAPSACQCKETFVRNENGTCIYPYECKVVIVPPTCGENEELAECAVQCEPTCEEPEKVCEPNCTTFNTTCQCLPGMVRNKDQICVNVTECPVPLPRNCSTVTCPIDKYCTIVDEVAQCVTNETTTLPPLVCPQFEDSMECLPVCTVECRGVPVCRDSTICEPGCVCEQGRKRNKDGKCVLNTQCYHKPGCHHNEVWDHCINCEHKCNITVTTCRTQKCYSGCACEDPFARNSLGECVPVDQCM